MSEAQVVTDVGMKFPPPSTVSRKTQGSNSNDMDIDHQASNRAAFSKGRRTTVFYLVVLAALYYGWQHRGNVYITPEEGPGYALGLVGGTMMLLLLMYPIRKHMRWARRLGPVRYWFRTHMLLGVLGPVCILYHCNFQLGSTNGNIALFSMLLVAGSGLVGRYFYTKIHYGLYGKKAELAHLGSDAATAKSLMDKAFDASPLLQARLQKIENQAVGPLFGFLPNMARLFAVNIRTHWYWISTGPALRMAIRNSAWSGRLSRDQHKFYYRYARHHLQIYLGTIRKIAGLAFYERLFSVWHILHLPLFFMLIFTGLLHVYAVHIY